MEYLRIPPEKMYRRYTKGPIFPFHFADILQPHLNIVPYIGYLSSLDEYCMKNIWNNLVITWERVQKHLSQEKGLKKHKYIGKKIAKCNVISREELDIQLKEFIENDTFLALFVVITIQNYLYP